MHFVLILTAALTFCAQAAPQFNKFNSRDSRPTDIPPKDQSQTDNENHNENSGLIDQGPSSRSTFTGHRRSNDNGRQTHRNYEGSGDQCWDPVDHVYRDRSNHPSPHHYPNQFSNDNFPVQDNYNPSMYQNYYRVDHHRGPQFSPESSPHHHGHGPPSHHHYQYRPPPSRPHHQYRPPPPTYDDDHHHHHHHHHHHNHHHEHGPPPYRYPYGPSPLPERPPRPPPYGNGNKLEICEDTSTENYLLEPVETSTLDDSGGGDIPSSSPVPSTSTSPKDTPSEKSVTQSTPDVKSTTQFDWNSFFPESLTPDTGGVGLIDVRMGAVEPV